MPTPPTVIEYQRSFQFEVTPDELWQAISEPQRFEAWWGWLGQLRVDGEGLVDGTVLTGTVSPPVPYRMLVKVRLDETVVTDAGLRHLAPLSNLKYLSVWKTKVTDAGVRDIKQALKQLQVNR